MKKFNMITSVVVLLLSSCYMITNFPDLDTFEGFIYFSILLVLILICITGIVINIPALYKVHEKA